MKKEGFEYFSDFERDIIRAKIDVHFHVGSWNMSEQELTPEGIQRTFDKFGYKAGIINSIKAIVYDLEAGNRQTADLLDFDDRFYGFVVINPLEVEASLAEIKRYLGQPKFMGLKTAACYYKTTLAHPGYGPILSAANEARCPILTHKYDLDAVAPKYPQVKFIAAHSMAEDVCKLAGFPNVYFDISASYAHRGETGIEAMVERAGSHRVVFSTDAQVINPAWSIGKLSSAHISEEYKENIFFNNAFALLNTFKTFPVERDERDS